MQFDDDVIDISLGGLESISSVYHHVSKGLKEYNSAWKNGRICTVRWNLSGLRSGGIDLAATAFFLAIAHRVRQYAKRPQPVLLEWNTRVLGFLSAIGFLNEAEAHDLFLWPYSLGGFSDADINPDTKILSYGIIKPVPEVLDGVSLSQWKKLHRESIRDDIILRCEALFEGSKFKQSGENPALVVSRCAAEIATNSLLWGNARPFMGLQRTSGRISINVSDIGKGFKASIRDKLNYKESQAIVLEEGKANIEVAKEMELYQAIIKSKRPDISAVAYCSDANKQDFGLSRAISTILKLDGSLTITSFHGEVWWGKDLWYQFTSDCEEQGYEYALSKLPSPVSHVEQVDRDRGYIRYWNRPIRGARVSMSIPVVKE